MAFPTDRFERAGATKEEIAQLTTEHDALVDAQQAAMEGYYASLSEAGLIELVQSNREQAVLAAEEPVVEEPAPEPVASPAGSSSAISSGSAGK